MPRTRYEEDSAALPPSWRRSQPPGGGVSSCTTWHVLTVVATAVPRGRPSSEPRGITSLEGASMPDAATRDADLTARLAPCRATDVDRGGSSEAEATGTQGHGSARTNGLAVGGVGHQLG